MSQVKDVLFDPILSLVGNKLEVDRKTLAELISDPDKGVRDFAAQDLLLAEIQAGVRTVDVLLGVVDLGGNAKIPKAAPLVVAPSEVPAA